MEKIVIFNANNESMQVEVVRYFSEGVNKYFIFSLHEIDNQGHMNIYVTKTVEQNGTLIGTNIIDDVEWSNLKANLQRIIKENRANGNAIVNDLPYNSLQNIKVADRRALKLLATSVDMLNMGYKSEPVVNDAIPEAVDNSFAQPTVQNVQSVPNNTVNQFQNVPNNSLNTAQNIPNNIQNAQQNTPVTPQNIVQSDIGIFNNPQNIPNNVQNFTQNTNMNQQPVQKPVENSVSENYKELYFNEKETTQKLTEENNRLINELNNYKIMISDIKNILSR